MTEYLSTYSWAILAAAVIVGIMFALGIFSSPIPIQSCILVPGYVCSHPILTDSGVLTFNLSYIGQTIAVTGIGCNSGTLPPTTLQNVNFILTSNKGRSITVSCPISSNAFGTAFQGHLWLQYNTQTQSGLVSDIGVILGAVNTRTSTSTTSTSTTSTSSTSSTSTSTSSTTSSTSTSTSTTTSTSSSTSSSTSTSTSTTSSTSSTSLTTTIHYMYCQLSGTRFYYAPILSGGALGSWTATTPYPSAYGDSPICVAYNGYIYCEGGYAALGYTSPAEYYAPYSAAGGLGAWKLGYNSTLAGGVPLNLDPSPCAVYNNYIECGPTDNPAYGNVYNPYYAPLTSAGSGIWTMGLAYPEVNSASCVVSGSYLYCIGGINYNHAYYAPLSPGIGSWTATTSYPGVTGYNPCAAANGYVYCADANSNVYYAPLSSGGIGGWSSTTPFPNPASNSGAYDAACNIAGGYIYCVTGPGAYYAPVSSSGVGAWQSSPTIPSSNIRGSVCVIT